MSGSRLVTAKILGHLIGVMEAHVVASYIAMVVGTIACIGINSQVFFTLPS
jgi:hypothetical protein